MLMPLTKQSALMYIKIMHEMVQIIRKNVNTFSIVLYTYCNSYLTFQLNLPLDHLPICRKCWFWVIYVLQGKVAIQ